MNDALRALSEPQREAVLHIDGPLVVFAGAGSGKTRVITHRIANLITNGIPAWNILALTFTNKAANEMRERAAHLCPEASRSTISTFHSLCARLLREFGGQLGFKSDYVIYDSSDAAAALKIVIQRASNQKPDPAHVSEIANFIEEAKMLGATPGEVENQPSLRRRTRAAGAAELYRLYQEHLFRSQAMDFGDLIVNCLILLRRFDKIASILRQRYRFILVDEFQDTNPSQMELLDRLSEGNHNLFVVGDDDQSIYSWRGASPRNLIDFPNRYKGAKRITLAENYRSRRNIVAAASALIQKNQERVKKELYSARDEVSPIMFRQEDDAQTESWYVANIINRLYGDYRYQDFAILYRTNAQSRIFEQSLRAEGIPFQIFGALEFFERLEIKDMLAYQRVFVNEDDDVSVRRILNVPGRGLGDKAVDVVEKHAASTKQSFMAAMREWVSQNSEDKVAKKLNVFIMIVDTLREQCLREKNLSSMVRIVVEGLGYREHLRKKFPAVYEDKEENLHELVEAMGEFAEANKTATLSDWLTSISLTSQTTNKDLSLEAGVSLMTLHTAKGLEFPNVFIVGVDQGLIPHRSSSSDPRAIEEERRLLYVGMTRAMERLWLVTAHFRSLYGQISNNDPSSFLLDIPEEYFVVDNMGTGLPPSNLTREEAPLDLTPDNDIRYETDDETLNWHNLKGKQVRHLAYGRGVVEGQNVILGQKKVTVRFEEFGVRTVLVSQLNSI